MVKPWMFASQFVVEAEIFRRTAAASAPLIAPKGNASERVKAPVKRLRQSTVPDGDSSETSAAASPEHWKPVTELKWTPVGAVLVMVTPALVPTAVSDHLSFTFEK